MNENDKRNEFETVVRPVIEWLNNNCNPHSLVTIDCTGAELLEGALSITTDDYIKD